MELCGWLEGPDKSTLAPRVSRIVCHPKVVHPDRALSRRKYILFGVCCGAAVTCDTSLAGAGDLLGEGVIIVLLISAWAAIDLL